MHAYIYIWRYTSRVVYVYRDIRPRPVGICKDIEGRIGGYGDISGYTGYITVYIYI